MVQWRGLPLAISRISHGMLMPEACCRGSERFSVRWHRGGPASQNNRLRGTSESGPASPPMSDEPAQATKIRSAQNLTRSRSSPPEDAMQYLAPHQPQQFSQSVPPNPAAFPNPGLNSIKRSSSFDGRTPRPAFADGERLLATEGDAYWVDEEPAAPTGLKVMPLNLSALISGRWRPPWPYTGSRAGSLYDFVQYIEPDAAADRASPKLLAEAVVNLRCYIAADQVASGTIALQSNAEAFQASAGAGSALIQSSDIYCIQPILGTIEYYAWLEISHAQADSSLT